LINKIVKASGELVDFEPAKLNGWASWADRYGVDWSNIALQAVKKCFDGCTTKDLQQAMIDACCDRADTAHMRLAGRLMIGNIYKEAYGGHDKIPALKDFYHSMVEKGFWQKMDYTEDELVEINKFIDHSKDLDTPYPELNQIRTKYTCIDRVNDVCYESPQFMYVGMAMKNMEKSPKSERLEDIKRLYEYLSDKKINAPTPFMVNLRTPKGGYASCCVSTTEDTAPSLAAADHINYMMTCASAGIGAHVKSRSKWDAVGKGQVVHQGKMPYYRATVAMVSANLQSSRGGAATMHFNCLDPEVEDLLKLKNPTTVTQKQIRDIDYSFGGMRLFGKHIAKNLPWMLISYAVAPDLYEAAYSADQEGFEALYAKYDADASVKKGYISARELVILNLTQRVETGRMYQHFTDRLNQQTPFKDKIYSSNLCQEIGLPTKGYDTVTQLYEEKESGEIGLCSLAALVAGRISEDEYEDVAYYALKMVDNVIELMDYPFAQLKFTAQARRSVGIGITNLAYAMAKAGVKYSSEEGRNFAHRLAELHSFSLHKASLRLAKERGVCDWIGRTKYPDGWFPHDDAVSAIDTVHSQPMLRDWETLRKEIVEFGGIRHSVLEAHMPCESSSVASGTLNGLYPVRSLKTVKSSGNGRKNVVIVPEYEELKDEYEIAWDISDKHMTEIYGLFQKFTGQGISADFYIIFKEGEERKVSTKKLITDYLYMIKMGLKTAYYLNNKTTVTGVNTGKREELTEEQENEDCAGGGCKL
jgi:ribonucleoside-diphosphate reductase alpha subunit